MADVLAGDPGIFPGNPLEAITFFPQFSKQFYVHFPPWTTWWHRTGLRLGFSLYLPISFP
jgi:hypothetical protein